jgi:hypothetical protein
MGGVSETKSIYGFNTIMVLISMVVVPGDSLALAPLAAVGGATGNVSKTGQQIKHDVEKKLPPAPWDLKPTGLGVPPPEVILEDMEMRARELMSLPLRLAEGAIPSPQQGLSTLESKRPLETVRRHVLSIPTPFEVFKVLPPGRDILTPRETLADLSRMMEDAHTISETGNEAFKAQYPVTIENMKTAQADLTALRAVGVEVLQSGAKSLLRVSKSLSKMLEEFSESGIAGLLL